MLDFIAKYNATPKSIPSVDLNRLADEYGKQVASSVLRQFTYSAQQPGGLRVSSLGKPAVLQALYKFGYSEEAFSTALHHVFHLGDVFEEFAVFQLKRLGYHVSHEQQDIEYLGVPGHIDFVVDDTWLVEVKTMSDGYFKQFTQWPNDDRGYLTQLAVYSYMMYNKTPVWLCFNKGTGEMATVLPNPSEFQERLDRAQKIVPLLQGLRDASETFEVFDAPPPVPEVFKKEETGNYLIPKSMAYTKYLDVFYDVEEGINGYKKPTRYVVGIKSPHESNEALTRYA